MKKKIVEEIKHNDDGTNQSFVSSYRATENGDLFWLNLDWDQTILKSLSNGKISFDLHEWSGKLMRVGFYRSCILCVCLQTTCMLLCILSFVEIVNVYVGIVSSVIFWLITILAICSFNTSIAKKVMKSFDFWFFQLQGILCFIAVSDMFHWDIRTFNVSICMAIALKLGLLDANVDVPTKIVIVRWFLVFLNCILLFVLIQFQLMPNTNYDATIVLYYSSYRAIDMAMSYIPTYMLLSFKVIYNKFMNPTSIVMFKTNLKYETNSDLKCCYTWSTTPQGKDETGCQSMLGVASNARVIQL